MKIRTFELDWAGNMMDSVIPSGFEEQIPQSATETGALEVFREMILYTPTITAVGLRAAIWAIELIGPIVAIKKPARFSSLDAPTREIVLSEMFKSKIYFIRQLVLLIKMTACFAWGADPDVMRSLGVEEEPKFVTRSKTILAEQTE